MGQWAAVECVVLASVFVFFADAWADYDGLVLRVDGHVAEVEEFVKIAAQ